MRKSRCRPHFPTHSVTRDIASKPADRERGGLLFSLGDSSPESGVGAVHLRRKSCEPLRSDISAVGLRPERQRPTSSCATRRAALDPRPPAPAAPWASAESTTASSGSSRHFWPSSGHNSHAGGRRRPRRASRYAVISLTTTSVLGVNWETSAERRLTQLNDRQAWATGQTRKCGPGRLGQTCSRPPTCRHDDVPIVASGAVAF